MTQLKSGTFCASEEPGKLVFPCHHKEKVVTNMQKVITSLFVIPKTFFSMVMQKRGVFDACDDEGKVVFFVEHAKKKLK